MTDVPDDSITARRNAGLAVVATMLDPHTSARFDDADEARKFAPELPTLALDAVFGSLWTRPGLSLRDRSLVTISMLVAQTAIPEMRFHFAAAVRNGVTRDELAEVIYQATAYAGYPAAHTALEVAREVLAAMDPQ